MNGLQRFFYNLMPQRWKQSMEVESRSWYLQCPNCEFEKSVWDWGGIRFKATGNSRNYLTCPNCGQGGWHRMYKKE